MKKITTEEFIIKANKVHNNKYLYNKSVYTKTNKNIIVTCRVHGDFNVKANGHTSVKKTGCPKCSGQYVRTKEEFIIEAKEKFGNKFNYEKVEFKTYGDIVEIICPEHGLFKQKIKDHLNCSTGCLKCGQKLTGLKKRLTKEEFITKSIKVHKHKYDYSLVEYINNATPVKLICKEHGEFLQNPGLHMTGAGCSKCSNTHQYTTEEFIEKLKKIHKNKYDYSLTKYLNSKSDIEIICNKHGIFKQKASTHLSGAGCGLCCGGRLLTKEEFLLKANLKFNNKYLYNLFDYINLKSIIEVTCPIHGNYKTTATNHLNKKYGCPSCSNIIRGQNKTTSLETFLSRAKEIHKDKNYDYSLIKMGTAHTKIKIICPHHGIFIQSINNHIRGQNCPFCDRSKGEEIIDNFLIDKNYDFIKEKTFEECVYKRILFFDFYLPEYNLCIEYDGEQHFKPIEWFGGEIAFKESLLRDEIKNKYCKDNDINLLRIPYTDKNIIKTLEEYLLNNIPS
jgi:hypothetical protein